MCARPLWPEGSFTSPGINEGGVAEDRRLGPLANDEREAVGQHLGGDPLLEALQVLSACGSKSHEPSGENGRSSQGALH